MKASQKAVLTFAIAAISTLSAGHHESIMQALREEKALSPASILQTVSPGPAPFETLKSRPVKPAPESERGWSGTKGYTILPVADALSRPLW